MTVEDSSSASKPQPQTRYARQLAERREIERIEQLANFGLAVGWACTLIGGFCWFCVVTRMDHLWFAMFVTGIVLLLVAILVPELLDGPCRLWMGVAHFQGWLVMSVLLTVIYFALITPAGWLMRRRRGTHPFHIWDGGAAPTASGWEAIASRQTSIEPTTTQRRSLPRLFLSTFGFFYVRGHFLVLPILVILMVLGVILFFVQGSVLAPFIYTIW